MRISEAMAESIVELARKYIAQGARIWLFGSRAHDDKKGGDIDLYIEVSGIENVLESKINFRLAFEDRWGELKVDILIHDTSHETLAIHEIAKKGVRLC